MLTVHSIPKLYWSPVTTISCSVSTVHSW